MIQIIPAILATTEVEYLEFINKINSSNLNGIDWIHIDLMDNIFVPNESISSGITAHSLKSFKKEAHVMVKNFKFWIQELEKVEFDRIIIHYEADEEDQIRDGLMFLKGKNIQAGLAINPETPVNSVIPFLKDIDVLLIMGVHPGFQGQKFIPETLKKIKECSRLRSNNNYSFKIEVDGGISEENIKQGADIGADIAVIGSALFKYGNLEDGMEKIREAQDG